jgi:hypothetical protein
MLFLLMSSFAFLYSLAFARSSVSSCASRFFHEWMLLAILLSVCSTCSWSVEGSSSSSARLAYFALAVLRAVSSLK